MKREADIARLMKEEHDRATHAQEQKELEKWQEGVRYAQELERQLEEKEKSKQEAYEEFLKGKSLNSRNFYMINKKPTFEIIPNPC